MGRLERLGNVGAIQERSLFTPSPPLGEGAGGEGFQKRGREGEKTNTCSSTASISPAENPNLRAAQQIWRHAPWDIPQDQKNEPLKEGAHPNYFPKIEGECPKTCPLSIINYQLTNDQSEIKINIRRSGLRRQQQHRKKATRHQQTFHRPR